MQPMAFSLQNKGDMLDQEMLKVHRAGKQGFGNNTMFNQAPKPLQTDSNAHLGLGITGGSIGSVKSSAS